MDRWQQQRRAARASARRRKRRRVFNINLYLTAREAETLRESLPEGAQLSPWVRSLAIAAARCRLERDRRAL